MSRLLCCLRARPHDMGAALSHPHLGDLDAPASPAAPAAAPAPPTMADVIRERKKKAPAAGLGTLRRRIAAAAARRGGDARGERGCEHARFIRSVVSSWRVADVFLLCEELESGAALRDLATQAELAREPARALAADLLAMLRERDWCDVELIGAGWSVAAHRLLLAARCTYFRELLHRYPKATRVPLEGVGSSLRRDELEAVLAALYAGVDEGGVTRRLAGALGFSPDALHRDVRYLLESGELCDARLTWRSEGGGGAVYGFRSALELPCHTLILAARSRFFRSALARRSSSGAVCIDEKVLPRRFASALLHAAYTDQVELALVGRGSASGSAAPLDDAFRLYEIASFLEMPIVVQGCEDAIVFALSAETLPPVLRWCSQAHASAWVRRQAMRFLRDDFVSIMANAASAALPRAALADALASPFLQASEAQALRAVLRWAERAAETREGSSVEPNLVWHTAHSSSRRGVRGRGARRRDPNEGAVREALATLAPLVRTEHLPADSEPLQQAVRRGLVPPPPQPEAARSADAWLGRGGGRPARCFLPYLDELKALLEGRPPPEAELAAGRRARQRPRIPDTLYMVRDVERGGRADEGVRACLGSRVVGRARARVRELRAAANATRALALSADARPVLRQLALRAVREMSLPDECAELLLDEPDAPPRPAPDCDLDCCREESCGRSSAGSVRARAAACPAPAPLTAGRRAPSPRLSAAVPDVAMAPNGNTHLLTPHYLYARSHRALVHLDLGDGAPHPPPPAPAAPPPRARELRLALELSVMRAYGSLQGPRRADPPAPLAPPAASALARTRSVSPPARFCGPYS